MGLTTFPECALLILFVFYDCSYCHDVFNTKSVDVKMRPVTFMATVSEEL